MALITETTLRAMLRTGIPNPFSVHVNDIFTPAASDFLKGRGIRVEVLKAQEIHSQRASGGEQKSIPGERPVIFPEVTVRINPRYALDFHLDLDEANAASLQTNDQVLVIGKNGKLDGTAGR